MNETKQETKQENSSTIQLTLTWEGDYAHGQVGPFRINVQKHGAGIYPWYSCSITLNRGPIVSYESLATAPGDTPEEAVEKAILRLPEELAEIDILNGSSLYHLAREVAAGYQRPKIVHVKAEYPVCVYTGSARPSTHVAPSTPGEEKPYSTQAEATADPI